jgi:hypothetical protein
MVVGTEHYTVPFLLQSSRFKALISFVGFFHQVFGVLPFFARSRSITVRIVHCRAAAARRFYFLFKAPVNRILGANNKPVNGLLQANNDRLKKGFTKLYSLFDHKDFCENMDAEKGYL